MLLQSSGLAMAIRVGDGGATFVDFGATWRFLRGVEAPSDPGDGWTQVDFDDSLWETGPAGFGYGDDDDATVLDEMRGEYVTVYIRKEFTVSSPLGAAPLELVIDYDDGFIAYLNGQEVARRRMPDGPADHTTRASSHEAGSPETIVLGSPADLLTASPNVLAIEGHNTSRTSSDFSLNASLRMQSDTLRAGAMWVVATPTATLNGSVDHRGAISVMVDDMAADFDADTGAWMADVSLEVGLNSFTAVALDADASEVDSGSIEIVYVPDTNHVTGELPADTILAGAWVIDETVTVPPGVVLMIEPGTVLLMKDGASLVVHGQLLALGAEERPIHWTQYGADAAWKQILFVDANDSRFDHCLFEYADSEGAHQDYYEPGSRDYHEAIVALACHIDVNDCVFQNMPDAGGGAEGDAIAIISDDPNHPGDATANVTGCEFLAIGQGVHTRYAYVLVEDCFFTGKRGDNDDVDLWGESTPPPLIQNNLFLNPDHDDMINPTRCSAVMIGNVIAGSDDHGVVLRGRCFPVMINNVIYDCSAAGIAVENACEALLVNNTVVDCGRGLRLFDLGRWGPPYRLSPGGGTATVVNCIIWDCPRPITLNDSPNTGLEDRGSHISVLYSDIEGGQDGVSVSGSQSTVTWGPGNLNVDPLFADPEQGDFHLQSLYGRWDPNELVWVNDEKTSPCLDAGDPSEPVGEEPFPHGNRINIGAYGGTDQASKSRNDVPALGAIPRRMRRN
jgi:hypothetical protein